MPLPNLNALASSAKHTPQLNMLVSLATHQPHSAVLASLVTHLPHPTLPHNGHLVDGVPVLPWLVDDISTLSCCICLIDCPSKLPYHAFSTTLL